MAVQSFMLPLGTVAPPFQLPDVVSGRIVSPDDFAGKPLLIIFLCAHCPYVIHVQEELARLGRDYSSEKLGIISISSNDAVTYPQDSPEGLKAFATKNRFVFPLAYDETQDAARAYQAACTPDFFLFDTGHALVYRGQLDDSRPGKGTPNGRDLRAAIEAVLAGKPVAEVQRPSVGCSIKWK
ncbi:MAG TPA: thioredoxin family protein [Chthoniobacterales bacterium]